MASQEHGAFPAPSGEEKRSYPGIERRAKWSATASMRRMQGRETLTQLEAGARLFHRPRMGAWLGITGANCACVSGLVSHPNIMRPELVESLKLFLVTGAVMAYLA